MKTGSQNRVFDYDTGSVDTNSGPIPQDFKLEKPAQASVDIDLIGETFEQRLVRLGKIAPRKGSNSPRPEDRGGDSVSGEMQKEVSDFTRRYRYFKQTRTDPGPGEIR